MERRKILLGSGAALATVLAGCSSSETDDDESEDDSDNSFDDTSDTDGSDTDDGDENGDEDEMPDVPGVDENGLELGSDKLTVVDVARNGDTLDVSATTTTTNTEEVYAELERIAEDVAKAINDPDAFKAEISTIEWVIDHEGTRVLEFYIDVQWAMKYLKGELTEEQFRKKVLATAE